MGTSLTGLTPAQTYDGLLKTTDNDPIGATEKVVTDGLGNNSALKVGTTSASVQGGFQVTGTLKDSSGQNGALGQVLSSLATGTSWVDVAGGLEGTSYVIVKGEGTPEENGQALLDGYTEAVSKIQTIESIQYIEVDFAQNLGGGNYRWFLPPPGISYPANTNYQATFNGTDYIFNIAAGPQPNTSPQVYVTDLGGTPVTTLNFSGQNAPYVSSVIYPAFLLIAPGYYTLPSNLVINHKVSVCSLSGERDVIINGNVQVSSGANFNTTFISGLNLGLYQFIVDANLGNITCRNIKATGIYSFGNSGALSGTYIDCFGGESSFASGSGNTASGTFIRCDAKKDNSTNGFSFGSTGGTTTGYFYQCGSLTGNNSSGGGYANFGRSGATVSGLFIGCFGQNQSFGSSANTVYAQFRNCISSGSSSFGVGNATNEGQYFYCSGGGSSFGGRCTISQNAFYYYCYASADSSFGTSFGDTADESVYIGCIAKSDDCFGKSPFGASETRGRLFNCTMNGEFAFIAGNGKIINCVVGGGNNTFTFTLVNS